MLKPKARAATYAEYGVKHCWHVDPTAKTLEALELTGAGSAGATSSHETPSKKWLLAAAFKDADPVTAPPLDVLWV